MELIEGLNASIRERKEETISRQEAMPENRALCTPSIVASLPSKESKVEFEAFAVSRCKPMPAKTSQGVFML